MKHTETDGEYLTAEFMLTICRINQYKADPVPWLGNGAYACGDYCKGQNYHVFFSGALSDGTLTEQAVSLVLKDWHETIMIMRSNDRTDRQDRDDLYQPFVKCRRYIWENNVLKLDIKDYFEKLEMVSLMFLARDEYMQETRKREEAEKLAKFQKDTQASIKRAIEMKNTKYFSSSEARQITKTPKATWSYWTKKGKVNLTKAGFVTKEEIIRICRNKNVEPLWPWELVEKTKINKEWGIPVSI